MSVLNDSIGSVSLSGSYWKPLESAGGGARRFNPLALSRFGIRDHRKLLVCDERIAFIGGFNIAPEYEGDGITRGWFDFGLSVSGHLAEELAAAFDGPSSLAPGTCRSSWPISCRRGEFGVSLRGSLALADGWN